MVPVVFILLSIFLDNAIGQNPHSCADLITHNTQLKSGVFTLYNAQNQAFTVFCEFHHGYGYTFVDLNSTLAIDPKLLANNFSTVLIRDLRKDGTQRQAIISQITRYNNLAMSVQYNSNVGYHTPLNANEKPFLYLGLLPASGISHLGDTQGYNLNGRDITFVNCDGNANSYFAFFGNLQRLPNANYNPTDSALLHQWVDGASPLPRNLYMPAEFYNGFEVHMGGCGAYGTLDHFPQVVGAALGLRYDIDCGSPSTTIAHGSFSVSGTMIGSTATYTCDLGYTNTHGDLSRTCTEVGRWTGLEPVCAPLLCSSHPCQNGGSCYELPESTYVCECTSDFNGLLCEHAN